MNHTLNQKKIKKQPSSSQSHPVLEVTDLSFSYPQAVKPILQDVTFVLENKSLNFLMGPNGSGKSTLLKLILGLLPQQDHGQIKFYTHQGEAVSRTQLQVGYVPQRFEFDASLPVTVQEFLELSLSNCPIHQHRQFDHIQTTLTQVKADHLLDKKLGDLSGGQLQRVVLSRALLHQPQLLILDEPETGIDSQGEKFFYQLLQRLTQEKNITVLIASHQMEIVSEYADQVLCLNQTLVCRGNSSLALQDETYQKLYGAHMQPYQHHHAH